MAKQQNEDVSSVLLLRFQMPVLTRWWQVGEAAERVSERRDILIKISTLFIEDHGVSNAVGKNASGLLSLLKEDMLFCDVLLIAAFHKYYLNKHFKWHQGVILMLAVDMVFLVDTLQYGLILCIVTSKLLLLVNLLLMRMV